MTAGRVARTGSNDRRWCSSGRDAEALRCARRSHSRHSWPSRSRCSASTTAPWRGRATTLATIEAAAMERDRASPSTSVSNRQPRSRGAMLPSIRADVGHAAEPADGAPHGEKCRLQDVDAVDLGDARGADRRSGSRLAARAVAAARSVLALDRRQLFRSRRCSRTARAARPACGTPPPPRRPARPAARARPRRCPRRDRRSCARTRRSA